MKDKSAERYLRILLCV